MSPEVPIPDFISRLQSGFVRILASPNPQDSLAAVEQYMEDFQPRTRFVAQHFIGLPSLSQLIDQCVAGLAQAALDLWPDWYGVGLSSVPATHVLPAWRDRAQRLASHGRLPVPDGFLPAIQALQLALALRAEDFVIALNFTDPLSASSQLTGLAGAASWLAEQSQAKIILLVPEACWSAPELTKLLHGGLMLSMSAPPEEPLEAQEHPQDTIGLSVVRVIPMVGRPHPSSPGEMKVAGWLGRDASLGKLFQFNQLVQTLHFKEYRVDLLWPAGKLVVEIDGYNFHHSFHGFTADRHRDYELLISGYRVLRLTHDEVMRDTERAIAKIRDSVEFIRTQTL